MIKEIIIDDRTYNVREFFAHVPRFIQEGGFFQVHWGVSKTGRYIYCFCSGKTGCPYKRCDICAFDKFCRAREGSNTLFDIINHPDVKRVLLYCGYIREIEK